MSLRRIHCWILTLSVGMILFSLGCRPDDEFIDDEYEDERVEARNNQQQQNFGFITLPVSVRTATGLSLADATTFDISLTDCDSGYTSTVDETSPNLEVYKFDTSCLARLTEFQINGNTYQPTGGDPFTTYAQGDTATFANTGDAGDELTATVTSTLSSPIDAADTVVYTFSDIESGADETLLEADVSNGISIEVSGQAAPQFTIYSVTLSGITAGGGGEFDFVMECDQDITGTGATTACFDVDFVDIEYKLVEDTYGGTLNAAQAAAIFATAGSTINTGSDVVAVGAGGTTHGGFNTSTLDGPDEVHNNPNMILILEADSTSYLYFNVDVQTITQN